MEHGTSLTTWIAYGAIVLFLGGLVFFFLRTMGMMSLLLIKPAHELWGWLRSFGRPKS